MNKRTISILFLSFALVFAVTQFHSVGKAGPPSGVTHKTEQAAPVIVPEMAYEVNIQDIECLAPSYVPRKINYARVVALNDYQHIRLERRRWCQLNYLNDPSCYNTRQLKFGKRKPFIGRYARDRTIGRDLSLS
jgi:hypothetical protein